MKVVYNKQEFIFNGLSIPEIYQELASILETKINQEDVSIVPENKKEENQLRDALLKKGTVTADGRIWFNEETAAMFISAFLLLEEGETLLWRDAQRNKIELTFAEAKVYTREIKTALQVVYGLTKETEGN